MVAADHPDLDIQGFLIVLQRLLVLALFPVDNGDVVVRLGHI